MAFGIATAALTGAGFAHADTDSDAGGSGTSATSSQTADRTGDTAKASSSGSSGDSDGSDSDSGDSNDGDSNDGDSTNDEQTASTSSRAATDDDTTDAESDADADADAGDEGTDAARSDTEVSAETAAEQDDSADEDTGGSSTVADGAAVSSDTATTATTGTTATTATGGTEAARTLMATVSAASEASAAEDTTGETPEDTTEDTTEDIAADATAATAAEAADAADDDAAESSTQLATVSVMSAAVSSVAEDTTTDDTTADQGEEASVAVATLTAAASTTTSTTTTTTSWLSDLIASFWLGWKRMFDNSTPTISSQTVSVVLDDSGASSAISFGAEDADGDTLEYSVTGAQYGTVTIDQATGTFVYTADESLIGTSFTDTFTVTVMDTGFHFHGMFWFLKPMFGYGATATVTIVVTGENQAPVAVADTISDIADNPASGNVLTNDSDPEGATLTATLATDPSHGTLEFASDGSFTYTPDEGFTGVDTFTYTASDGVNTSAVATVTITVADIVSDTSGGTLTIGVQGLDWFRGLSEADLEKALDMSEAAGVTSVRISISWFVVESTEGTYDWSDTDPLVTAVLAHNMTVLAVLYDTPTWLSGSTDYHTPPADPETFAVFAAAAAEHYAGQIDTWEIWNEENLTQFWSTPDPVAYTNLLKAVYPAIKAVDPDAVVVVGGLGPAVGTGIAGTIAFVEAMYAAGAAGYFDVLAVHPYFYPALPTMDAIVALHELMVANGDGDKEIWLTEVGAPTGTSSVAVSEEVQAATIALVVEFARENSYVGAIYFYSLLDTGTDLDEPEDNFGLLESDFTPKLAWGVWLLDQEDLDTVVESAESLI